MQTLNHEELRAIRGRNLSECNVDPEVCVGGGGDTSSDGLCWEETESGYWMSSYCPPETIAWIQTIYWVCYGGTRTVIGEYIQCNAL